MARLLETRNVAQGAIPAFSTLMTADRVAAAVTVGVVVTGSRATSITLDGRPLSRADLESPQAPSLSAAYAGHLAITAMTGLEQAAGLSLVTHPSRIKGMMHDRPMLIVVLGASDHLPQLVSELRRDGCDPIVFDGADPAAFAWAIFEIGCRQQAEAQTIHCVCHQSTEAVPVGVATRPLRHGSLDRARASAGTSMS